MIYRKRICKYDARDAEIEIVCHVADFQSYM